MRSRFPSPAKSGNRLIKNGAKSAPASSVAAGQIFEGVVRDVVNSGDAVVEHPSGIAVFVRGAWIGERVKIKITESKSRFARGEVVEVLMPNEHRISPACDHFSPSGNGCGGCAWLFIDYPAQLAVKQTWVEKGFAFIGARDLERAIKTIKGAEPAMGYRNRVEFKTDGKKLGFLAQGSNQLIDVKTCPILIPKLAQQLQGYRQQLPKADWERTSQGKDGKKGGQYTIVAADDDMEMGTALINSRLPFKQGNGAQNEFMKAWLQQVLVSCDKSAPLLELFCGAGNFTQVLHHMGFEKIIAAELASDGLKKLENCAYPSVVTKPLDLFNEEALGQLCRQNGDAQTLVLDPPRDGLVSIEPLLAHKNIRTIAYISCDLATCTRDVKLFVERGYRVQHIQPVDMFPQTPHVELCILLTRNRN